MHAVRVPLLGMAVAVALLLVENVGAVAYREHAMAPVEAAAADARKHSALRDVKREMRRIRELLDAKERELEELKRTDAVPQRILELEREIAAIIAEVDSRCDHCRGQYGPLALDLR